MTYISREAAIEALRKAHSPYPRRREISVRAIQDIPPADVVTREAFNRILAENDDMREQLAKIGKKPGDKMDDVRTYAIAKWVSAELAPPRMKFCSRCWARKPNTGSSFCSSCGADMRKVVEIDQVKEAET